MKSNKIGLGIITCNRQDYFIKLLSSLPDVDKIITINDGDEYDSDIYNSKINEIIQHKKRKGVGKSKNDALKYLLSHNCNHIFLIEDDILLKDSSIIDKYIEASKETGILHFNYAYHGALNRKNDGTPNPLKIVEYNNNIKIAFHYHVTGALSYYRDEVLYSVGLLDEKYKNILEHVEHTYRIIKGGFHPPFRWFADLANSYYLIDELDPQHSNSIINSQTGVVQKIKTYIYYLLFLVQHGYTPGKIPIEDELGLMASLDKLKKSFSEKIIEQAPRK